MNAARKPVILTYHSIADGPSPLEISPEIFAEQMQWLKANARVVPLAEIVKPLKARTKGVSPGSKVDFEEREVALTFDDGFLDFHSAAAPVLLRLGLPATVFLPTAFVGKTNAWPGQPAWVKPQSLMNWEQIRELAQKGIEFGSHSATHPDLTNLTAAELEQEFEGSKKEIEAQTNQQADFFCFPYGRWNHEGREAASSYYVGACSTGAGVVEQNADPYALPRVDAHYVRAMDRFRTVFTDSFVRYVTVRRWIRRLRGQPEGIYSRI